MGHMLVAMVNVTLFCVLCEVWAEAEETFNHHAVFLWDTHKDIEHNIAQPNGCTSIREINV